MDYLVFDDDCGHADFLKSVLKRSLPDFVPIGERKKYDKWPEVHEALSSTTSQDTEVVVFLDLSILSSKTMDSLQAAEVGCREAQRIRTTRPNAVLMAFTQYQGIAEDSGVFDGVLGKDKLIRGDRAEVDSYVRKSVCDAINKHAKETCPIAQTEYELIDSLGVRLTQSAFGFQFFTMLVRDIAATWTNVRIAALTSGHSGAYVLLVVGKEKGLDQGVVVKCARNEDIISEEIRAVEHYLPSLGVLGGHLASIEHQHHKLTKCGCWYYRQSHVVGETLLNRLAREGWVESTQTALKRVTDMECEHYSETGEFGEYSASERYVLGPIDLGRARTSLPILAQYGHVMARLGQWPDNIGSPDEVATSVDTLISNWETIIQSEAPLLGVLQHGDLNPGNILLSKSGNPVLIDLARLGVWPVGYDLCRLATMLRLRLTDSHGREDWIVNRVTEWYKEDFCQIILEVDCASSKCPPSVYCDQAFRAYVEEQPEGMRVQLRRGYMLGTLWDLTKVFSYSDISPFKAVWAMIAWRQLAHALGL